MSVSTKITKSKIEAEFEEIEKNDSWAAVFSSMRDDNLKNEQTADESKKPQNRQLNRYRDVNPYDHSRVVLNKDGFDYINASHVPVARASRNYILSQGPLAHTVPHFWLMIWEQNSKLIVMLNNLIEKNQVKCAQYWPDRDNECIVLNDVDLSIELISMKDHVHYVVRVIRLTDTISNEERTVTHFHYTTWPDFGVPKNPYVFLKFLHAIQQSGTLGNHNSTAVVHCSAGIGRSGTFCLVDSCLFMMRHEGVDSVDVRSVLMEMRKFRMGLIQTSEQLRFSYLAIIKGLALNWDAVTDEEFMNGADVFSIGNNDLSQDSNNTRVNGESDGDHPPTPPPRSQSLEFGKPLPNLPPELSSSDNDTDNGSDSKLIDVSASRLGGVRKRKHLEAKEMSKRIAEKVQEMRRQQLEAESRKQRKRSIMKNVGIGLGTLIVSGALLLALVFFQKSNV